MIQYSAREGIFPIIWVCDICNRAISDVKMGAIVFRNYPEPEGGRTYPARVVHKGNCHNVAEARAGGKENCGWFELGQAHEIGGPNA